MTTPIDDGRPVGQRAGINDNPLGSAFRDGPGQYPPKSDRAGWILLALLVPAIVLAVILL
jgi:hypothetical protein